MPAFTHPFDYLVSSATRKPSGIAISTVDVEMTFAELLDTARRMARFFREAGIRTGDVVAVRGPALLELVASFAIFHEAAVGTNVPSGYLDDGSHVIDWIVSAEPLHGFPRERQIIVNPAAMQTIGSFVDTNPHLDYTSVHDVCRVAFSSGTTGRPKAIPFSIDTVYERCIEGRERWMLERPFMCHLGLGSILAFMSFFAAVVAGDTYISPGEGPEIIRQLQHHRVACLVASPHQLGVLNSNLSRDRTAALPTLSVILSTGSVLPEFLGRQIEKRTGARVVVAYASSEAGTMAIRSGVDSPDGFAGEVAPGVEIRILDDNGTTLKEGLVGHIAVRRSRQPQSYLDRDETGAFLDGFFLTGDTGYLRGNQLYLAGRVGEIINAAGVKVDPARVEAVAFGFPGVTDAAAFGFTDQSGLSTVALAFVSEQPVDFDQLTETMRSHLGESAPRRIARLDHIPRTESGKVLRDEVARLFTQRIHLP
jgi:acyl-coenzyme A synthetase/AMP-(fatty) acid ligase